MRGNKKIILLLLVVSWMPVSGLLQPLLHLLPLPILIYGVLTNTVYTKKTLFFLLVFAFSFFSVYGLIRGEENSYWNLILSIILYFPIVILIFRFRDMRDSDIAFFVRSVSVMSIFQLVVGLIQLIMFQGFHFQLLSNAWDAIVGTTLAKSSHVFSIKMLFQAFVIILNYKFVIKNNYKSKYLLIAGVISAIVGSILSSYLIGIIMSLAALFMIFLWRYFKKFLWVINNLKINSRQLKTKAITFMAIFLIGSGAIFSFIKMQPGNVQLLGFMIERIASMDFTDRYKFQKIYAYKKTVNEVLLDNPLNFSFGVGAGQYSSRAALMLTGDYLNTQSSYFPIAMSKPTKSIIWPLWNKEQQRRFRGSTLALPSGSVMSIIAEFGFIGMILFFGFFLRILFLSKTKSESLGSKFVETMPYFVVLLFSQLIMDLWLEYGSFMIFVNLIFVMALSVRKNCSTNNDEY